LAIDYASHPKTIELGIALQQIIPDLRKKQHGQAFFGKCMSTRPIVDRTVFHHDLADSMPKKEMDSSFRN